MAADAVTDALVLIIQQSVTLTKIIFLNKQVNY